MAPWPPCAWSLISLARPSLFGGTAVGRLCLSQCRHQGIKVVLRGKAGLKQAEPVSALSSHLFFDGDGKCMEEAQRAEQRQEPLQAQRRFEEAAQLWQLGTKYSTYHIIVSLRVAAVMKGLGSEGGKPLQRRLGLRQGQESNGSSVK